MKITGLNISGAVRIESEKPGANLLVFGAVHGDEPCGALAIRRLLFELTTSNLPLKSGTLTLVIANEKGLVENKRYLSKNLNRLFRDDITYENGYECDRAHELKPLIKKADFFLDIHSTSRPTKPFLFAEKQVLAEAQKLNIEHIVVGWNTLTGVDLGGDTESFGNQHNVPSLTLECGQSQAMTTWEIAYQSLLQFCAVHQFIEHEISSQITPKLYHLFDVVKLNSKQFNYVYPWENLTPLKNDQLIGKDENQAYRAPRDCTLIMPGTPENTAIGEEIYFLADPA
ncbi:MAG: succinylglutamate desuccinylase/aspartoacylase family protein [Candidatus Abawacabacteria bacterium]|nr:succinylglutamate desuccinylase/aspartoacylase family protein [Candidatus Abawacabacteria bacterium]